ncbi:MAG: hypothetical protein EOM67_13650 [Spirochaetia bacterium]|nr:hypothetical protein [Spirochaetia bacterium]
MNIVNPQCGNASKNIDLDRKDVRARANDGNDFVKSLIYNAELKDWMNKKKFSIVLNRITENLPIYGSCILEKVDNDIKFVPLKNCIFDPAVSNKDLSFDIQSPYFIKVDYMQPWEMEKMSGWNKDEVKQCTEDFRNSR